MEYPLSILGIVALAAVAIPLQFLLIGHLVARWTGWRGLSFRHRDPLGRTRKADFGWQSARIGEGWFRPGYNNCLSLAVEPAGLGLRLTIPIIPAHPPLFIPWREVSEVTPRPGWLGTTFTLRIPSAGTTFVFRGAVGERIYATWYAQRRDAKPALR